MSEIRLKLNSYEYKKGLIKIRSALNKLMFNCNKALYKTTCGYKKPSITTLKGPA